MARASQLTFAIRAVNEASRVLRDIDKDLKAMAQAADDAAGRGGRLGRELADVGDSAERAGRGLSGLRSHLLDVAKIAGGFVVGTALTNLPGLIGGVVKSASDLNETISKTRTIFGESAAAIEAWAQGAARGFGQSKQQALEAASTFGNIFVQLGVGTDEAAKLSMSLTQLASDFASFHNVDITDVLNAQASAFRGEYDALQRYIPSINAAAVAQKALALTGKQTTDELTDQEKALAAVQLMIESAGPAMGDFARTSDSLANKQRILKAEFANMRAELGEKLLPVAVELGDIFLNRVLPVLGDMGDLLNNKVAPVVKRVADDIQDRLQPVFDKLAAWARETGKPAMEDLRDILEKVWEKVQDLGGVLEDRLMPPLEKLGAELHEHVVPQLERFGTWLENNKDIVQAFAIVVGTLLALGFANLAISLLGAIGSLIAAGGALLFAAGPAGALAVVIALLAAGVFLLIKHWDDLTERFPWLGEAADKVREKLGDVKGFIERDFIPTAKHIGNVVGDIVEEVRRNWDTITAVFEPPLRIAMNIVKAQFDIMVTIVRTALEVIGVILRTAFDVIFNIIKLALALIRGDWGAAWEALKGIFEAVWSGIVDVVKIAVGGLVEVLRIIWDTIKENAKIAWEAIKDVVAAAVDRLRDLLEGLWSRIKDAAANAWESIKNHVIGIFDRMRDAASGAVNDVVSFMAGLPWRIVGAVGDLSGVLYRAGRDLIQGFINGIKDMLPNIPSIPGLGKITGGLEKAIGRIPGFASGGFLRAGEVAIVGEQGPELFVPATSGYVIPNGARAFALSREPAVEIHIHGDVYGVEDLIRRIDRSLRRQGAVGLV